MIMTRATWTFASLASLAWSVGCSAQEARPHIPVEEIVVEADALSFDALEAGPEDGPVVLLLHGFPATSRAFEGVIASLAEAGYHAVAPDLRGYSPGARPPADGDYALTNLTGDVVAIADALGADRVHLVGHDWGAALAWMSAGLAADRVETLTAISIPHPAALQGAMNDSTSGQREASRYTELLREPDAAARLLADDAAALRMFYGDDPRDRAPGLYGVDVAATEPLPESLVADYLDVVGSPAALEAALAYYRVNWPALQQAEVALDGIRVSQPTLYVWGERDFSVTAAAALSAERFVDGPYRLETLDEGHWIPELAGDVLADTLLDHLNQHGERRP